MSFTHAKLQEKDDGGVKTNFFIYCYICPVRSEVIYIGKGSGNRHLVHLRRKDKHPLTQRIQWIRNQGLEPVIDFICQGVDEEFAFLVEQEAIAKYGRKDLGKGPLLNLTDGGDGIVGHRHTEDARSRISAALRVRPPAMKGRHHTEETKRAISVGNSKKRASLATRQKMSDGRRGILHTAETKMRISEMQRGRRQSEETKAKRAASLRRYYAAKASADKH